jgi:hypothetical protein
MYLRPPPLLLALSLGFLPAGAEVSRAEGLGIDATENCIECGFRKPGHRSRELAILETTASALREPASPAPLDFSKASSLPLLSRPTSAQADAMAEGAPLLRAMHTDHVIFTRMRYLLPEKFRIADGKLFQPLVDDTIQRMAGTEAGRKLVCEFQGIFTPPADPENPGVPPKPMTFIQAYFGVSPSLGAALNAGCKGVAVPPAVAGYLRLMGGGMVPPKKIVFLFSDGPRPPIEAYTSKRNVTYLVLTRETENRDSLDRMLEHEMAMSYDQLSRFGYHANVATLEDQGTPLGWGKGPFDFVFEAPKTSAELEKMKCGFRDPAIRYAATAQRAFVFEDSVTTELGGSPNVQATGTCAEILAKNSVLLQGMARTVSWDTGWYNCGIEKDPQARLNQVLSRIRDVAASTLTCKDPKDCGGRKQVSLCEVLLNPRVGPFNPDLESGGPRPRMGGGWDGGEAEARMSLMSQAADGGTVPPAQAVDLGKALLFPNIDDLHREEDREGGRP